MRRGWGPWVCHDCEGIVTPEDLHIHHADHDRSNDDPENLVPMHMRCHHQHHSRGNPGRKLSSDFERSMADRKWSKMSPAARTAEIKRGLATLGVEGLRVRARRINEALGPEGRRARALKGWETRRQQRETC